MENDGLRASYDDVVEKRMCITLKDRCRLLIKQSVGQYPSDIEQLSQLPLTLRYFLSFDILNPNFVALTLERLNRVEGRMQPSFFDELQFHEHALEHINGHHDWEDLIPEDMDQEEDDEDAASVRRSSLDVTLARLSDARRISMTTMWIFSTKRICIPISPTTTKTNGDQSSWSTVRFCT